MIHINLVSYHPGDWEIIPNVFPFFSLIDMYARYRPSRNNWTAPFYQ